MKKIGCLILLLVILGCVTPQQELESFCARYDKQTPQVVYRWELLGPAACVKSGVVYVNTRHLDSYKACLPTILKHEFLHTLDLKHCDKQECIMHYKTHNVPIHLYDKEICKECEAKIWQ
jgi:predicted Zn-dependent protease